MNKAMMLATMGGGGGLNPTTKAFITALETDANPTILTNLQKKIVDNFVKDLLAINSIQANFLNPSDLNASALKAVYPLILNANANKYNLCDPRNLDAANRLVYQGTGYTHDVGGVKAAPGVSNLGINTFFVPSEKLNINSIHLCTVHNEDQYIADVIYDIGSRDGYDADLNFSPKLSGNFTNTMFSNNWKFTGASLGFQGIHLISKTAAAQRFYMHNSSVIARNTVAGGGNLPTRPIYFGCYNSAGAATARHSNRYNYVSLGGGISEQAGYYYQIAINRFLNDFKSILFFLNDIDPITWVDETFSNYLTDDFNNKIILK